MGLLAAGAAAYLGAEEVNAAHQGPAGLIVISPESAPPVKMAAELLADEVPGWRVHVGRPPKPGPSIWLAAPGDGLLDSEEFPSVPGAYALRQRRNGCHVLGADPWGVWYGVGRLLRAAEFKPGRVALPSPELSSEPLTEYRGHEASVNGPETALETYVRELSLWGMNWLWYGQGGNMADDDSPHEGQAERDNVIKEMESRRGLAQRYGMKFGMHVMANNVWPDQFICPSQPGARERIRKAREALYRRITHLDAVMSPSADPGGCSCDQCQPWVKTYLSLMEEHAAVLRQYHPQAEFYITNQLITKEDNEYLYAYLRTRRPDWLTGIAWGPLARPVKEIRENTPEQYRILLFTDITHATRCQNPVEGFTQPAATFYDRRSPTYRPKAMEKVFRSFFPYSVGTKPYSEGVFDDLNKAVWSSLHWKGGNAQETVLEYCRRHFGAAVARNAAEIIFALERTWSRPYPGNEEIADVLRRVRAIETRHPELRERWRWEMLSMRAILDRYLQQKLEHDEGVERRALQALAAGGPKAIRQARGILDRGSRAVTAAHLRKEASERRASVRRMIGYDAYACDRYDIALNNRDWLLAQFDAAEKAGGQSREDIIGGILHYEDAGPGGFYDNCGSVVAEPHHVAGEDYFMPELSPDTRLSQRCASYGRREWDIPLVYVYEGLDPAASYEVEVTYVTRARMWWGVNLPLQLSVQTLSANGLPVHGPIRLPEGVPQRLRFPIPRDAVAHGRLELRFALVEGRGSLVSEIWLRRVSK